MFPIDFYTHFHMKLDKLDLQILSVLQTNADLTHQELAKLVNVSVPTCQRRVKRLKDGPTIERLVAVLDPGEIGEPLTAILEVTLANQCVEVLDAFEGLVCAVDEVQQCYRLSSGPDFLMILSIADMAMYNDFAHSYLTAQNQVRSVRTFFSTKRSKFSTSLTLKGAKSTA